uniref:Putative secreted peptide n=1 Tax=Anopheles braziliensis TaxID=58242 RepID=A0A2M3ZWP3_9DIPT
MAYASTLLHLLSSDSTVTSAVAVIASSVDVVRKCRDPPLASKPLSPAVLHDYVSSESDNGKGASFRGNALRELPHRSVPLPLAGHRGRINTLTSGPY